MRVLTSADMEFFDLNGYLVVHDAVPPENLTAVVDAIFDNLGMLPDDPSDWYRPPLPRGGMVEMYHHQSMWDNRQHPRVHQIFSDLFATEELLVSIDRVSFRPPRHPEHPEYDHKGFVHWDVDTSKLPVPFGVQGVLYLTDTTEDQGGFVCIPGFHRGLEEWIAGQPKDRDPFRPNLSGLEVTPIPGRAGDLVIWNRLLAHGNGHNVSGRPRFAQYITMYPATLGLDDPGWCQERIECWRTNRPPAYDWAPGDPRGVEQSAPCSATLTDLGSKLLGLSAW